MTEVQLKQQLDEFVHQLDGEADSASDALLQPIRNLQQYAESLDNANVCSLVDVSCTAVLKMLERYEQGRKCEVYDAVANLYRKVTDLIQPILNTCSPSTSEKIAIGLYGTCEKLTIDFGLMNLAFKNCVKALVRTGHNNPNYNNDPTLLAMADLLLTRLHSTTADCVTLLRDAQANDKQFTRISRIFRFYLSHATTILKTYGSQLTSLFERVCDIVCEVRSWSSGAVQPVNTAIQAEYCSPLGIAVDTLLLPFITSVNISVQQKREWLQLIVRKNDAATSSLMGNACVGHTWVLALFISNVDNIVSSCSSEEHEEVSKLWLLLLDTVIPVLFQNTVYYTKLDTGTTPSVQVHMTQGINGQILCCTPYNNNLSDHSPWHHLWFSLVRFSCAIPSCQAAKWLYFLRSSICDAPLPTALLLATVFAFMFRFATDKWKEQEMKYLMELVVRLCKTKHIQFLDQQPTNKANIKQNLTQALTNCKLVLMHITPYCSQNILKLWAQPLHHELQQPRVNFYIIDELLKWLSPAVRHHLLAHHYNLWERLLDRAVNDWTDINQRGVGGNPSHDTYLEACMSTCATLLRNVWLRNEMSSTTTKQPPAADTESDTKAEACIACLGGRYKVNTGAEEFVVESETEATCGCTQLDISNNNNNANHNKDTKISQLCPKLVHLTSSFITKQQAVTSHSQSSKQQSIGWCIFISGILLPCMNGQGLIKLLNHFSTELKHIPYLSYFILDFICRCAFLTFPKAIEDNIMNNIVSLFSHYINEGVSNPILHHTLLNLRTFLQFTSLPCDKLSKCQKITDLITQFITSKPVDDSRVPIDVDLDSYFGNYIAEKNGSRKRSYEEMRACISKYNAARKEQSDVAQTVKKCLDETTNRLNSICSMLQQQQEGKRAKLKHTLDCSAQISALKQSISDIEHLLPHDPPEPKTM